MTKYVSQLIHSGDSRGVKVAVDKLLALLDSDLADPLLEAYEHHLWSPATAEAGIQAAWLKIHHYKLADISFDELKELPSELDLGSQQGIDKLVTKAEQLQRHCSKYVPTFDHLPLHLWPKLQEAPPAVLAALNHAFSQVKSARSDIDTYSLELVPWVVFTAVLRAAPHLYPQFVSKAAPANAFAEVQLRWGQTCPPVHSHDHR